MEQPLEKPDHSAQSQAQKNRPPETFDKLCDKCHKPKSVLVRCQYDESGSWHFVCPAKCWTDVSGGIEDGDDAHPNYRYGGMWKNKHAGVSAKKKSKRKQ